MTLGVMTSLFLTNKKALPESGGYGRADADAFTDDPK